MQSELFRQLADYLGGNSLELVASFLGFACVWLAAQNKILNWPVAMLSTLLYAFCFAEAHLFSDALLQVVFLVSQIYGWLSWAGITGNRSAEVTLMKPSSLLWTGIVAVAGSAVWYMALVQIRPDASLPLADSATTVLSLIAIWMQARKILENWIVWLIADLIYIPVYLMKGLYLTAILYGLFLGLAIYGFLQWRKLLPEQGEKIGN